MTTKLEMAALNSLLTGEPYCPRCGSTDGYIGTQGAYFVCQNYECIESGYGQSRTPSITMYWCCNRYGWDCRCTWTEKVAASPFGRR